MKGTRSEITRDHQGTVAIDLKQDWMLVLDLSRTLIPLHNLFESHFNNFLATLNNTIHEHRPHLVNITDRSPEECHERFEKYHLPLPQFLGTDLGSTLCISNHQVTARYPERYSYNDVSSACLLGWNRDQFLEICSELQIIEYAEESYQNLGRVSFYVRTPGIQQLTPSYELATTKLNEICPFAKIIVAFNEDEQVGYLDIVCADKGTSFSWLKEKYYSGDPETQIIAYSDSGGDMGMCTSGSLAVLVKNADQYVKLTVREIFKVSGEVDQLFVAGEGEDSSLLEDGRYISVVFQGLDLFGLNVGSKLA